MEFSVQSLQYQRLSAELREDSNSLKSIHPRWV